MRRSSVSCPLVEALPGPLQRLLATHVSGSNVARLRAACRGLHAALGHDTLWRTLFAREWGAACVGNSAAEKQWSWAEQFAGRAAQRERWRRHDCVEQHALPIRGEQQFEVAVHAETLFVSTGRGQLRVFSLPHLTHLATWLPHADPQARLGLWLCGGTGSGARLVTHTLGASLRVWLPRALSVPATRAAPDSVATSPPPCELELELPKSERTPFPLVVFSDTEHRRMFAICYQNVLSEWSLASGQLLRHFSVTPGAAMSTYPFFQYHRHHLAFYASPFDPEPISTCSLDDDGRADDQGNQGTRGYYGPLSSLARQDAHAPHTACLLPDLGRPRSCRLTRDELLDLRCHIAAITAPNTLFDLAHDERFLVLLLRDETLIVIDYGPPLPSRLLSQCPKRPRN